MPVKLILIHGLNNNLEAFGPLKAAFTKLGYECHVMCLPGHGENRDEARNLESAFAHFDQSLTKLIQEPYFVLAFSQGALFLQLWLSQTNSPRPLAQLLLAPALYIRNFETLGRTLKLLPSFMTILSVMPKPLRRYWYLNVWEYRTLFEASAKYQTLKSSHEVPTKVLVDPKDEVVDAQKLQKELGHLVELVVRDFPKGTRPGKHHIIFHPDYFRPKEWENFISKIDGFFRNYLA